MSELENPSAGGPVSVVESEKKEVNKKTPEAILPPSPAQEPSLETLEKSRETQRQEIGRLTDSIEITKTKINEVRKQLGLPPTEEDPPSISTEKEKLEKLRKEEKSLDKELLIRQEKEKILQEKINELFKEFSSLTSADFESVANTGQTSDGKNFENKSFGILDPKTVMAFARMFKEGVKLLPKILDALPGLLKQFDDDLTKEATERVEKELEKEKTPPEQPKNEIGEMPVLESQEKPESPTQVPPTAQPLTSPQQGSGAQSSS